jgi:hypothetical protein
MTGIEEKENGLTEKILGRWTLFFGVFLCLFQLLISFPVAVWKRNKFNFEAPLTYSYSVLGLVCLTLAIASILIALLTPRKLRHYLSLVLVILAAAIFIQQNFMAWDYGILDGHRLDFEKNRARGYLDLLMWGVAIGVPFLVPNFVKRQSTNILLGIGAMAIIGTGINIKSYGTTLPPYTIDERAKFDFSRNKNIILFLFDAYQMDVFLDLADTQPELLGPLEGFTAYENNAAVFAKTYPTIPLLLTGKRYQKKEPLLDFFKLAYKDSLMAKLQEDGWDVGLYPHISRFPSLINTIDISPQIMDNAIGGIAKETKISTYLQALNLSIFRAVPHDLKPTIFNDGEFILTRENPMDNDRPVSGEEAKIEQPFKYQSDQAHPALGFKELINQHGSLATDDPVFRFYHLMLPHSPFLLDADLRAVKHQETFESYKEYSIAALKLVGEYLERLKDIGAYDNSTILIVSDHGMGVANYLQYESETQSYRKLKKWGYRRAAAKSILLAKLPQQRGAMARSLKPVSGIDIAPTIAAAAGIKTENFEGKNIDDISLEERRSRIFNFYSFSTWDSKYLDDFEAYEITGNVRDRSAWKKTAIVTDNTQVKNRKTYQLGELLSFGKDIKTDSDFLNAFIEADKHEVKPNYIEAKDGSIDVKIKLKTPPPSNEALLLQFEIYSGDAIDRKLIVNGKEMITFIKPKMRQLNRGFFISPDVHKGAKIINLSFAPVSAEKVRPLRLSSIKFSAMKPAKIQANTNLLQNANAFFPVGLVQKRTSLSLPSGRVGSLIFNASSDICKESRLRIKFKSKPSTPPILVLNSTPLVAAASAAENETTFSYDCLSTEITSTNVLEVSIPDAYSHGTKSNRAIGLQEISFTSNTGP